MLISIHSYDLVRVNMKDVYINACMCVSVCICADMRGTFSRIVSATSVSSSAHRKEKTQPSKPSSSSRGRVQDASMYEWTSASCLQVVKR
jgi:hypothetical protein